MDRLRNAKKVLQEIVNSDRISAWASINLLLESEREVGVQSILIRVAKHAVRTNRQCVSRFLVHQRLQCFSQTLVHSARFFYAYEPEVCEILQK